MTGLVSQWLDFGFYSETESVEGTEQEDYMIRLTFLKDPSECSVVSRLLVDKIGSWRTC